MKNEKRKIKNNTLIKDMCRRLICLRILPSVNTEGGDKCLSFANPELTMKALHQCRLTFRTRLQIRSRLQIERK